MVYLKLLWGNLKTASRDKRELSVAKAIGYEVQVIEGVSGESDFDYVYEGYNVCAIVTQPVGKVSWLKQRLHWVGIRNIFKFVYKFVYKTWIIEADIISGHDWFCLLAAYIANLFKWRRAKLIYDSHEFELYRYAPGRTEFQRKIIKLVEGFLIRRVDLALMVGDKIADGVQEIYSLKTRPTVVRNIPPYWHLEPEKSAIIRRRFLAVMKLSSQGFLLMYHGGIDQGRGIECAIRTLVLLPDDVGLIIMGNDSDLGMVERLRELARKMGVERRVLFKDAVPIQVLKDYIGAVDVEMVLIEGKTCRSYAYSLPNKFFESIQACVPMICSDLPEMGKIVRQYDTGLLVNEDDEKSVAEAVLKLRGDKGLYDRLRSNMAKAREELCWEQESLKLKAAIQGMMG